MTPRGPSTLVETHQFQYMKEKDNTIRKRMEDTDHHTLDKQLIVRLKLNAMGLNAPEVSVDRSCAGIEEFRQPSQTHKITSSPSEDNRNIPLHDSVRPPSPNHIIKQENRPSVAISTGSYATLSERELDNDLLTTFRHNTGGHDVQGNVEPTNKNNTLLQGTEQSTAKFIPREQHQVQSPFAKKVGILVSITVYILRLKLIIIEHGFTAYDSNEAQYR